MFFISVNFTISKQSNLLYGLTQNAIEKLRNLKDFCFGTVNRNMKTKTMTVFCKSKRKQENDTLKDSYSNPTRILHTEVNFRQSTIALNLTLRHTRPQRYHSISVCFSLLLWLCSSYSIQLFRFSFSVVLLRVPFLFFLSGCHPSAVLQTFVPSPSVCVRTRLTFSTNLTADVVQS